MAREFDPHDELETQTMRDLAKSCYAMLNGELAEIIQLAQTTYDVNLHDDLKARLKARLESIDHLEDLLQRCGRESDDALASAQRRRNLRKYGAQITETRQTILTLATGDEELKDLVATRSTSHKTADTIADASKIITNVGHCMIRLYETAQSINRTTNQVKCRAILHALNTYAEQLSYSFHRLSGFEGADSLSMLQPQDIKWQSALEGFRWSQDYLLQRLKALDMALVFVGLTPMSGKRGYAHDVLVYPFVDIHFLKQNVTALAELHRGRQEIALQQIAYFFTAQDDAVSDQQSKVKDQDREGHGSEMIDSMEHDIDGEAREAPAHTASATTLPTPKENDDNKPENKEDLVADGNGERCGELNSQREGGDKPHNDGKETTLSSKPQKAIIKHSQIHANMVGQQADSIVREHVARHRSASAQQWRSGGYLFPYGMEAARTFTQVMQAARDADKNAKQSSNGGKKLPNDHHKQQDGDREQQIPTKEAIQLQSQTLVPNAFEQRKLSEWLLPPYCTIPHWFGLPAMCFPVYPQADKKSASDAPKSSTSGTGNYHERDVREAAVVAVYPTKYNTDNASHLSKETIMTSASILAEDMKYPILGALNRKYYDQLEKFLHECDEDVNGRDNWGNTALEFAIKSYTDDPKMVRTLLKAGADITLPSRGYPNALLHVLRNRDFQLALIFAEEAPEAMKRIINDKDSQGLTPLLFVIRWSPATHYPTLPVDNEPSFLKRRCVCASSNSVLT